MDWADQLHGGTQRNQAMAGLAFAVAQVSPRDAANLVAVEIPAGVVQEEAAFSVLHQWALHDFAGASAWAAQFSESPFRDRAEQELAGINRKLQTSED